MLDASYLQDYDVPRPQAIKIQKKLYAKAIYDNIADSPDELAFKKGDVLTVIEQDTDGLKGWWLCCLRGREGLCPGNRLRILNSYDSGCYSLSPPPSPCPSLAPSLVTLNSNSTACYDHLSINSSGGTISSSGSSSHHHHASSHANAHNGVGLRDNQQTHLLTQQQRQGTRRSWHVSPNKVITPQRYGDVYIYNCPAAAIPYSRHSQPSQQLQQQQQQLYSNQSIYQNISMMSATAANGSGSEFETYDTPKPATPVNYDCPKNVCRTPTQLRFADTAQHNMKVCSTPIQEESYDVPRPLNTLIQHQNTLTPSSSNSSLLTSDSLSLSFSSSNRSSLANMPDYDVPRRNPLPVRAVQQQQLLLQQRQSPAHGMNGNCAAYDFPLPSNLSTPVAEKSSPNATLMAAAASKELPLELSSALYTLDKLQFEAKTAITKLLSFVTPSWRQREKLEPVLMDVKLTAVRLRTALHDLSEFGEGALGNATRSEDRNLALKLRPHVRALRDADKLVHDTTETLDAQGWAIEQLLRSEEKFKANNKPPDSLDQLIACAQTLTEDVRQTTSFIHGNASLLFKRSLSESGADEEESAKGASTTQEQNTQNRGSSEWVEDYDYVSFESKDAAAKKNSALREAIPANLKKNFDTVIKAAETTVMAASNVTTTNASNNTNTKKPELTVKDKKLVCYYAVQISTHMGNLQQAIDSFLETVEKNQPPKFFIAYGKFVVVSAHNLVTIGDIVHRNVSKAELREKILRCTDALSEALKTCVQKSKKAAAQFPSVTAVQEMVDSVVDISHLAADLKVAMLQAVQLSL
ncbi:breast cancer anti-estrogen resistance protein 1 isoform X2 [Zeugodacus cucurbitae]|uniref:breast cancer anti-estrogen resistance protein 1 isoform X2 n=1 Tax=Zeugodacus cucurbitae TaxID=28588 RepID=UPI000596A5CE|nr:breast cancer anti-estrogen resistance protein 1 isoform X2 [Zeugodacus cucurbitae]